MFLLLVVPFVFGLVVGFVFGVSYHAPEPSGNDVEYVLPASTHDIKGRIVI